MNRKPIDNSKSTDVRMAEIATGAVKEYVTTDEFRGKIEAKYYTEIKGLVDRAEKRATKIAGFASVFMFGIFTIACSLQYLNIREKRTQIYEKYVDALSLVNEFNNTITDTKTDVDRSLKEIDTKVKNFELDTRNIEHNIRQLNEDIASVKKKMDNLGTQGKK